MSLQGTAAQDHELVPCDITDDGQTIPAPESVAAEIVAHLSDLCATIEGGRSDGLHFSWAGDRFFSQYLRSSRRELRTGGPRVLVRKLRNLRPYHLELIRRTLPGWVRGRSRQTREAPR